LSGDPTAGLVPPLAVLSRFRAHDGTLADFLSARIEAQPWQVAMEFEGRRWTYAELGEFVARWRAWLAARQVGAGDGVAVMALNNPNTVALLFALASIGAMLVPINPEYGVDEAAYVLHHAQVRGVLHSPDKRRVIDAALAKTG
jgi:crotonobetaine/carnitine-CoA ligase